MKSCSLQDNFTVWASPLWKSFMAIPYHWQFLVQYKELQKWLGFLPDLCWLLPLLSSSCFFKVFFSGEGEEQMQFLRKTDTDFTAFCVWLCVISSCLLCGCLLFWVHLYTSSTASEWQQPSVLALGPRINKKWWYLHGIYTPRPPSCCTVHLANTWGQLKPLLQREDHRSID